MSADSGATWIDPYGPGLDWAFRTHVAAPDITPPLLTVPPGIAADATAPTGKTVTYPALATDNVDGPIPVTCNPASGSLFGIGDTVVTCSATDAAGNTASASFTVHVRGAAEQLARLAAAIKDAGPGTSLSDKVVEAQTSLAAGKIDATCDALTAIVNSLQAQSGKTIPPRTAALLIVDATRIESVLACAS
jgi:hypothetical protein